MRKEEIYLDLEKLNGKDRKEVWDILKAESELFYRHNSINNVLIYEYNRAKESFVWANISNNYISTLGDRKEINLQQFKDLFTFKGVTSQDIRNTEEELFKDLTIGQEIEMNGYVLKVERMMSQWYVNKDTMKFIKSNYQPYGASLVTDKDFINQLEKFSK